MRTGSLRAVRTSMDGYVVLRTYETCTDRRPQVNTRDVEQIWKDTFTYLYREEENFIFPITLHPDVSGYVRLPSSPRASLLTTRVFNQPAACPSNDRKCLLAY